MGNHPYTMYARSNKFKPDSVIVITGASSGMGRELTLRYAQRECRIVIASRNMKDLQAVADECQAKYNFSKVVPIQTDVTNENDCKNLIDKTIELFGKVDLLVLNAGVSAHFLFEDCEDTSVFKKLMDVNFYGYLYPTRYALPHLKKSRGQIAVMSSYSGEIGLMYRTAYCASKFAVTGFFEALRMEQQDSVKITIICPPTTETNLRKNAIVIAPKHSVAPTITEAVQHTAPPEERTSEYLLLMALKGSLPEDGAPKIDHQTLTVDQSIDYIMMAIDTKMRKVIFPHKAWTSSLLRPIIPDYVDTRLMQFAKM